MNAEEQLFLSTLKGKRVKISLKTSSVTGVIQRICPNKMLVLSDVVTETGSRVRGSKMFYGRNIFNVELEEKLTDDVKDIQEQEPEDNFEEEEKSCQAFSSDAPKFLVIDDFHETFVPAVMDINKQSVIGVGADGVELHKHGRLCWLQIATDNKIYIFDILSLGARAFKNGLSMILENKKMLKVIHDCRPIAGCLFAQFSVKLINVFDTQVADVMCFRNDTAGFLPDRVSTLPEVLRLHLNIRSPQLSSLRLNPRSTKKETQMWYKRPCPIPLLKTMALSVMHLRSLRNVLLDNMMTDFMMLVDSYITSSRYGPDDMEEVDMESVLQLPSELRQLQEMHSERREEATGRYPVTKLGLLERFNPRPQYQSSPADPVLNGSTPDVSAQTPVTPFSPQRP